MKRIGNIFSRIVDYKNIELADENARKGKLQTPGVRIHDRHKLFNLGELQRKFDTISYKTSEYFIYKIYEPKEREIYRLPYYPDRIAHHALMNVLEPIWEKVFIHSSYACRKNKGIHVAATDIKNVLRKYKPETKYCLKLDIKKFYPSIDHDILKEIIKKKIKDIKTLKLLDEIIDSAPGVPIGNYLSQYFANLYLTYFDHWLKEKKHIRYYFRYADDIVILHNDKSYLHSLCTDISEYLTSNLKLELKKNYQVFPVDSRGIDFVGYKFFHTHTLLRKGIKNRMKKLVARLSKAKRNRNYIRRKICSYSGWLKFCDSINLCKSNMDKICGEYMIPTPEHICGKKDIISNILDKPTKIIGYKVYEKYFKLYVVTNKLRVIKSTSIRLFKAIKESKFRVTCFIKRIKNKYFII